MRTLTIRYRPDDGITLDGTTRDDRDLHAAIKKAAAWKYSGRVGWYVQGSRAFRRGTVESTIGATLRAIYSLDPGLTVHADVDWRDDRTAAERAEQERQRAAARADRLEARADRKAAEAAGRFAAASEIQDMIPIGQPILVGHHSERRHRRDLERIDTNMRKGVEAARARDDLASRARTARARAEDRVDIGKTRRRIDTLMADRRRLSRRLEEMAASMSGAALDKARWAGEVAAIDDEIAYLQDRLAAAEAAGAKVWSRGDFAKGDMVLSRGGWYPVVRVNAKSVTVPSVVGGSWTDTIRYDDVQGRATAAELEGIDLDTLPRLFPRSPAIPRKALEAALAARKETTT